jgi:hypothetical protein
MLQRGVDLANLDVSYVSSLSWYFLVTFGLSGIHRLILGDEAAGMEDMMQMQVRRCIARGGTLLKGIYCLHA